MTGGTELRSYDNRGYANDEFGNNNTKSSGDTVLHRDTMTEKEIKREKLMMMKNVIVISIAFMLLFTSFQSMANLQSSINKVDGLGTYSLSVIYASLVISCMFVPTWLIKKLTVKWAMCVSMFCYSTYIAAQFYPEFYTLIPGAIILGLGAAPMWSAKCTYLTQVGNKYGELTGQPVEPIIVRFFGIFFLFFQSSSIWGNLISSAVLSTGKNATASEITEEALAKCGLNYCPAVPQPPKNETVSEAEETVEDNFKTSLTQIYTLAGVYLVCSVVSAVVVALFVDPLSKYGEQERDDKKEKLSGFQLLLATFRHMTKPYQILIIPLTFWSGVEQGFFGADFTAGYVACAWGVQNIGYVLITYGVCDALCSFGLSAVINCVGRLPIFIAGAVFNFIFIIICYQWAPNPDQSYVFFIMAAIWGVADAVWQTQINALYGVLFESDEEAAFSNYRLWESLGFIFAYILQTQVCIHAKTVVLIIVLLMGMGGYFTVEFMEFKKKKNNAQA